jgi:hypothetical protein
MVTIQVQTLINLVAEKRGALLDDAWAAIVNTAREVGVSEVSIQRAVS